MVAELSEHELLERFGLRRIAGVSSKSDAAAETLIDQVDLGAFVETATGVLGQTALRDILHRAVNFSLRAGGDDLESSFIILFAALESVLTFFRRQDEWHILPSEDFARLERELKRWLKQHPLLADESARRGLIYEKIRELNRFPFSHLFQNFCARYSLDVSDLWPLVGRREDWPLMEIRHRLVHGDPFAARPPEAMLSAHAHLRWTVERMLLSVLDWPVSRSHAAAEHLRRTGGHYQNWQTERARFS